MSFLRTSIFAVFAIALGFYIYLFEAPKIAIEAKGDRIVDVDAAQIERIKLTYPDATAIELARRDGAWRLVAPIDTAADSNAVDQFVGALRDATIERRIAKSEAETSASYGLDTATGTRARLELTLAGGKTLPAVIVGNTTPVDYHAFVRVEGSDDVLLTPLIFHTSIKKTAFDFRTKALLHVDPQSVVRLTIEKASRKIKLEKNGDRWALTSPAADSADTEAVRALVSTLPTIESIAYFDGAEVDRAKFGLDSPSLSVKADLDGGGAAAFKLGAADEAAPAGSYFERIHDGQASTSATDAAGTLVAKVADWVATTYGISPEDVRDRNLVHCRADDVVKMAYIRDGETFVLSREGAGKPWNVEPAGDGAVVQRIADNALRSLVDLRGDTLIGDADDAATKTAYALDKPLARVELSTKNGLCGAITAGSREPGVATPVFYLQSDDRTAVLTASASQMSRLSMKRSEFVEMKAPAPSAPAEPQDKGNHEPAAH